MFPGDSTFLDSENLYKDPKEKYPIPSITSDSKNCFFNLINQYKKNRPLSSINKETPRLITERKENVLGGKKGNVKDSNRSNATITFMK